MMKSQRDEKRADSMEGAGVEEFLETGYVSAPLLNVGEAAKYLGVGRKILFQLIERGEITVVRAGGSTLVEKNSLDRFREEGTLT
jgi:excisionase family DNA binding protein